MAKPRLILRDLRHPGLPEGSFELNRSPIRIGRGPRCEIRLHSERIADVQVILRHESDRWTLHPVGPAEGCEIHEGFLSESAHLDHGTKFRIGHVEMMLALRSMSPTRPASEPELTRTPEPVLQVESPVAATGSVAQADPEPAVEIIPEPAVEIPVEIEAVSQGVQAESPEPAVAALEPVSPPEEIAVEAPVVVSQPEPAVPVAVRPAFAAEMVFPDHELTGSVSKSRSVGRSLKIGPLRSPASSSAISAFGAITGAELAATAMPLARTAISASSAAIASAMTKHVQPASTFGVDIPRSDTRVMGRTARPVAPAREEFIAPIGPSGSRAMPLRRYLRDHDSSNLCDGSQASPASAGTMAPPLSFDHAPCEKIAVIPVQAVETPAIEPDSLRIDSIGDPAFFAEPEQAFTATGPVELVDEEPAFDIAESSEPPAARPALEASIQEFETWLDSVGPDLEPVATVDDRDAIAESAEEPVERLLASDESQAEATEIVTENVEIPTDAEVASPHADEAEPLAATVMMGAEHEITPAEPEPEALADSARFESSRRGGIDSAVEDSLRRPEIHEWPSAQDILRWSEDRHGRSFLLASSEDLKSLKVSPARTRPHEWMRMNFPTALALCLAWLGGAAALTTLGYRMSVQDELTQKSMSAMLAAEKSGASPRIDPGSMERLTKPAAWWEIPPVQRWFRAAFVRMREEKGQPLTVTSAEMAAEIAREAPLYPPARIWKSTNPETADVESGLEGMSLDVLPLVMQADIDRRRGQEAKANETDKVALKLAADGRKPAKDEEIVYDAEFGTNRFLLPGQKRMLAILKRLTKEPNAEATLLAVMPEDSPLVWLTAAQLMRHAGVGDAEALARKVSQWPIPAKCSTERRQLIELTKAEANAMLGQDDLAIETYERLVKEMPESEWKRTLYLNLGMLNLKSLKPEAAKMALKKARGEDPYHEIDRHAIATIRGLSNSKTEAVRSATTVRAN